MKTKDLWIFTPSVIFYFIVYANASNIPILDDYDAVLKFVINFSHASILDKCELLFSQHNEHQILHSRIIFILYYWIAGAINFRSLILIGAFQLIPVASVVVYFVKKTGVKHWQLMAFIWVLLVFDLSTYESGSIAMYAIQNYGILMLFFCSLYFFSKNGIGWYTGIVFQFLCIFSGGNGILASFFIVLYVLRQNVIKKWGPIIVMTICAPLYFIDYVSGQEKIIDMGKSISYFIRMTGAHFSFYHSFISGIIILAAFFSLVPYKKVWNDERLWSMVCIAGFVLSSMTTIALIRGVTPDAQFQTSRYLIYPQLLISIT